MNFCLVIGIYAETTTFQLFDNIFMPTDYMESDTAEGEPAAKSDESTEKDHTCLVNKTIAPDAKPGDKLTVEVVHVYEDELAVKPTETESPEEDAGEAGEEPVETAPAESSGGYME